MKNFKLILASLIMAVGVASCDSKDDIKYGNMEGNAVGTVSLSLDAQITTLKSSLKAAVDPSTFAVKILDSDGNVYRSFTTYASMPSQFELKVGTYSIVAYNAAQQEAAFDAPYYEGKKDFTIVKDQTTTVDLTCSLANMAVSISYTDNFKAAVKNYTVTVSNGAGNLIFDSVDKVGYFKVAPLTITLNGKAVLDDSPVTFTHNITSVAAKDYHKIQFDFSGEGAGILTKPGITVNESTNEVNTTITVPAGGTNGSGSGSGGTTPTPTAAATITGLNGLNLDQPLVYSLAGVASTPITVQVKLEAPSGIKNLNVTVTSAVVEVYLPKTFDLANLETGLRDDLIDLGVLSATDQIKGATSFVFDISAFMGLLDTSTHEFAIELVPESGSSATKTLVIKPTE